MLLSPLILCPRFLQDNKGSVHSMHNLIYEDIKTDSVRDVLLAHIQRQARRQQAHFVMGNVVVFAVLFR